MKWKGSKLLKHFLQLLCLIMAWFTAMSRVSDYKHHWSDVLAGLTLGTIIALVVVNIVYKSLISHPLKEISVDNAYIKENFL
jgi:phosphatidate phosphatase